MKNRRSRTAPRWWGARSRPALSATAAQRGPALAVIAAHAVLTAGCASQDRGTERRHDDLESHLMQIDSVVILPADVTVTQQQLAGKGTPLEARTSALQRQLMNIARHELTDAGYDIVDFDFAGAIASDPAFAAAVRQFTDRSRAAAKAKPVPWGAAPPTADESRARYASLAQAAMAVAEKSGADAVLLLRYVGFEKSKAKVATESTAFALSWLLIPLIPFTGVDLLLHAPLLAPPGSAKGGLIEAVLVDGASGDLLWIGAQAGAAGEDAAATALGTVPQDLDPPAGALIDATLAMTAVTAGPQLALAAEIERYAAIFGGSDFDRKRKAIPSLAWSGISDGRVYQPIADELMQDYRTPDSDRAKQLGALAGALAYSGDAAFLPYLEAVASGATVPALQQAGQRALDSLPRYTAWNPVILAGIDQPGAGSLDAMRTRNMLQADIPVLVTAAAERVYADFPGDPQQLTSAHQSLSRHRHAADTDPEWVEALDTLMKVPANSGNQHYYPSLAHIAQTTTNPDLARRARRYARALLHPGEAMPESKETPATRQPR